MLSYNYRSVKIATVAIGFFSFDLIEPLWVTVNFQAVLFDIVYFLY